MRHLPALDGLRGLAVAAVLAYHFGYLDGGYLGVDLFFVLSGFLITSLLLGEHASRGRIGLRAFWGRRARRLLPALFLLLLGIAVFCVVWARPIDLAGIRADGFGALFYVANWRAVTADVDYWSISLAPSPLQHVWSLAIEEQFYLVWPLVVLAVLRGRSPDQGRRRLALVAGAGAALSVVLFVSLHARGASDTRVYEGTDTRAFALLLGALVACWLADAHATGAAPGLTGDADPALDADPTGGADPAVDADPTDPPVAVIDPDVAIAGAVATDRSVAVAGAEPPVATRHLHARTAVLAATPAALLLLGLAWVALDGTSDLLYQGGLPVASLLAAVIVAAVASTPDPRSATAGATGGLVRVLSVAPLRGLGLISYGLYLWHWPVALVVDENRTGLSGPALLGARVGGSLALALASYLLVEHPIRRGSLLPTGAARIALPAATALVAFALVAATADAVTIDEVNVTDQQARPTRQVAGAPSVLYVGDSVAASLADFPVQDPDAYGVNAYDGATIGCGLVYEDNDVLGADGEVARPKSCTPGWPTLVERERPDVAIVVFGATPLSLIRIDGGFRDACDPRYGRLLADRLAEQVEVLAADGAVVVLATNPPTTNPFRAADAVRLEGCRNDTVREVAATTDAELVDLDRYVCPKGRCRDEIGGDEVRPDSMHFNGPGGARAARWLLDEALRLAGIAD
jgi:peptidoglycan/LPS O-acetylase OafA/YrhL